MKQLLVLFVLFVLLSVPANAQQTQTGNATTIQLKGLKDRVVIRRDERGIPYIEAKNDEDLYFAQGYATAADRLWQMDLFRRNARGELSEILPNVPGSPALDQDKLHRTLGFAHVVEAELAQASPQSKRVFEAYAAGVNAYIASLGPKQLPPEFQILGYTPKPWTPADSLIVVKIFFEALSNTWRLDLMREAMNVLPAEKRAALMPEISPIDVLVVGDDTKTKKTAAQLHPVPPLSQSGIDALARDEAINRAALEQLGFYAEGLAASNNWVVSGKHTVSGKPLLANDPHLAPTAPPIWHMVHLTAPGIRVAGVTSPGLPGVVIGHNDRIAWGFTNVGPDVQDVYLEKFDPNNPNRYQTPAGWQDAKIRHEEIKVRKGLADLSADTITLDVTETRHGPIVLEREGKRYALRWTALDPTKNKPDSTFSLNRARNWSDFNKALESFTAPTQNIVYADVDGHIGYHAAGVVPIRKSGDGSVTYDGSTDDGEWIDYIPVNKLPQSFDPPSGIIVTANQRIVGTSYPYFLTRSWAQPYRARRIYDLLQKPKLNTDDFRRIQGDVYSIAGVFFTKEVVKTLKPKLTAADEKLSSTLNAFESWDGLVTAESKIAPLVSQMRLAFRSRVLTAALGDELVRNYQWSNFDTTLDRVIKDQPADWLPKDFPSYADLYRACYDDAIKTLTKNLGPDETKWTWGEMVKARFPHPLAGAPLIGLQFTIPAFPQNGTGGLIGATVNVGSAVSMRLIADPANWDLTQHGISVGESGVPSSPHWKDQLDDWKAVTPRAFPFTEASIAAATKETLTLTPAN
jgi:penicillin amidase